MMPPGVQCRSINTRSHIWGANFVPFRQNDDISFETDEDDPTVYEYTLIHWYYSDSQPVRQSDGRGTCHSHFSKKLNDVQCQAGFNYSHWGDVEHIINFICWFLSSELTELWFTEPAAALTEKWAGIKVPAWCISQFYRRRKWKNGADMRVRNTGTAYLCDLNTSQGLTCQAEKVWLRNTAGSEQPLKTRRPTQTGGRMNSRITGVTKTLRES